MFNGDIRQGIKDLLRIMHASYRAGTAINISTNTAQVNDAFNAGTFYSCRVTMC